MLTIRKSDDRGHADHGWLNTYHTFSFGDYNDSRHMRFRSLRVINEDIVAPGQGFGMHPHQDMEILTWIVSGALQHKDSMGNGEVIRPGDLQHMTAGTGVLHSEFNPSKTEPVHLLQIWIMPDQRGLTPGYAQQQFPVEQRRNRLQLLASGAATGANGSIRIHQDAVLYASALDMGKSVTHDLANGRHGWLQMMRGTANVNGQILQAGDGVAISDERRLSIAADTKGPAEFLLFDLA